MRAILLLLGLAALAGPAAAAIDASVEPRVIDELDTARLTIRVTGTSEPRRLDLDVLEQDFEVLTTQTASQYRSVNGQVQTWVEYQVMLRPKHSGQLTIPPISVGGEATEPLTLEVRGIDEAVRRDIERMVFFESELTRNPVYVQAQTVLIRRLYYASGAQIYSDLPGTPEIPDAVVMPLGETASSTEIRDGERYGVIEQRFAIFPERSGELEIPVTAITSSVRVQSGGRTRRSGVRIATEPMTLEVRPVPPEYPADQPWLPAEDLTLFDRWTPVDARIEVGDPITRTLTAHVEGNLSSVIPPLEPALPGDRFRRYPEPPELKDEPGRRTVRGQREQRYSIIATAPGTVTVPPTELVWWDVDAETVRTASAPGRTFRISGAPAEAPPDPVSAAAPAPSEARATEQRDAPPVEVDVREDQVPWPGPERRRTLWLGVLGLALLAGALILGSRYWPMHARPSRRRAWRALRDASRGGEPDAIHHALLEYLRVHYRAPVPEAVRRFRLDGHGDVLDALNASRYRPVGGPAVPAEQVLAAVRALRRARRRAHPDPLPALYD
ncbi:MAG TPA: BatD family protein [Pseudomonadales bacterium]